MIEKIVSEVKIALANNLYLAALSLALTLPDICGKAKYPSETSTARYIRWYNDTVDCDRPTSKYNKDMPYLSGEVIYNLRNSFFHQGTPNINKKEIKNNRCKIDQFTLLCSENYIGDTSCVSYKGAPISEENITERRYTMNIRLLCIRLCRAAEDYFKQNKEKFDFFNYHLEYNEEE